MAANESKKAAKAKKASARAAAAEASQPQMPKIKLAQLAPVVVMFALNRYDLAAIGYVRAVEVLFVVSQILCFAVLGTMWFKIAALRDSPQHDALRIKVPEVKQLGQVIAPAVEQTVCEYDTSKWKESAKQTAIGCVIMAGVYYKWRYYSPLVLQVLMAPLQLYESPLFQVHFLKREVSRPFPTPSLFSAFMPETSKAD